MKFNNLPGGRVLELGIQVITQLWTIQKYKYSMPCVCFQYFLGDWSESWTISYFVLPNSWFWDWQVLAILCLSRGNPDFTLLLGLPLNVDVVSLFSSAVVRFLLCPYLVVFHHFPDDSRVSTACQCFFHPSFRTSDYQLETLGYHSSFLPDFRLPGEDSWLPYILPSGPQTTSWRLLAINQYIINFFIISLNLVQYP